MAIGDLNTTSISGTITKHGVIEGKFPKAWMLLKLDPVSVTSKQTTINDISFFVSVRLSPDNNSKKGERSKVFLENLKIYSNVLLRDVTFANIKRSIKKENNTWEDVVEPGFLINPESIFFTKEQIQPVNLCVLEGIINTVSGNKLSLAQRYSTPVPGSDKIEFKDRFLPILLDTDVDYTDKINRKAFFAGSIACTSSDNKKIFLVAKKIIVYDA